MKKNLLAVIVMILFAGVVSANTIDGPKSPIGMAVVKTGSIFKVFYKGVKTGNVKLTIYGTRGEKVFTETLKNIESFVRPYNFSSLSEGEYIIELMDDAGKQVEKISYHNGKIERYVSLKRLVDNEGKYVLTVSNKGEDVLSVRIFDYKNTLLYSGTEKIVDDFGKVYNLNKVRGQIFFEITDKNGTVQSISYNE